MASTEYRGINTLPCRKPPFDNTNATADVELTTTLFRFAVVSHICSHRRVFAVAVHIAIHPLPVVDPAIGPPVHPQKQEQTSDIERNVNQTRSNIFS
jgi:hypothetical protein